ncbi:transcription factor RFX3 isoform X2 [Plutella xylostella]|uniref:transcription factor RFX3 isoform X2 n=1 Tax=Plutella xylostella TaxID=51655 RepID=UPI00203270E6|nr:transcription factor RFX3 isoform X2 [Plutella xylostella]
MFKIELCSKMTEMGFENVFYLENFECVGDEVLVESSPPASPAHMAARLAHTAQSATGSASSPGEAVRDAQLIVIPEISNTIQLQHAMQQVSSTVVEVNGDSGSGHSSPSNEQHTYIAVASEGGNSVNYHVHYVEPQELYGQGEEPTMETLRTYPVYDAEGVPPAEPWRGTPCAAAPAPRMPPATIQWLHQHYEVADGVSLPRSTLYSHYLRHCSAHRLEPVNAASFGKLIRSVFVGLRTRRLGTRGNSKYHYYGIRAKPNAPDAMPPDADERNDDAPPAEEPQERPPTDVSDLGARECLGAAPTPPPLIVTTLPEDMPPAAPAALTNHHRTYGVEFLAAVSALDTGAAERARRAFWKRLPAPLSKPTLHALMALPEVIQWLHKADLALHQRAVELLLPDVLRPIPAPQTQAIRNFAKSVESALAAGSAGAPPAAAKAQAKAAAALSAALRRYTSLNHLAQAARAVLTNHTQIHQMLADLNRVDFKVVREQAAWACSCTSPATAYRLEADFKATLGRGATLEQWAVWLENCVRTALAPHSGRADYSSRARRLLLDWSFYSSLVIRELTLRSAASFGSFHLIRLLYDEYVAYLIERRVAAHEQRAPIAVMHHALDPADEEDETEDSRPDDEEDPDWEWDDEQDDSDAVVCKKHKIQ